MGAMRMNFPIRLGIIGLLGWGSLVPISVPAMARPARASHQPPPPTSTVVTPVEPIAPGDRYQIFESPLNAKWTFRLDRYCGGVDIMVVDKNDDNHWLPMRVLPPPPACSGPSHSHFELFSSNLVVRMTFLMDTANGTTWELAHDDKTGEDFWTILN